MLIRAGVSTIFTSTSTSTSTWLLHEYERWLMSTSTSTDLWSTFYTSTSIAFFCIWKGNQSSDSYKPLAKLQLPIVQVNSLCQYISIWTILCNLVQWHLKLRITTYWLSWLTITICCQFKIRRRKLRNIMKCVENSVFFKHAWSKNFHTSTSWMGKWTWMNDNNKQKHHNSNSVIFLMMIKSKGVMEFAITSHVTYIQIISK